MSAGYLSLYVIYDHPADYPNHPVIREHLVNGLYQSISAIGILCSSLDEARASLPYGLHRMPRMENDDPAIVEVWL